MKLFKSNALLILMVALTLGFTSCSSNKKKEDKESMDNDQPTVSYEDVDVKSADFDVNSDSDSGTAGVLKTVNFPFDSSSLTSNAREALKLNAEFLKTFRDVEVQVEGHCDERGGVQYNLALGERRAKAVKDYLVSLGVSSRRISTISFGKERPIAFGHDPAAWAKNRRANFVITDK